MITREFKARGIREDLQIYRKLPSADDESEMTTSWDSFDGKRLSRIVLQANEVVYKPIPKGARKALRTVDYYVFDVGIIREQFVGESSFWPESPSLEPLDELFLNHRRSVGSNANRGDTIPNSEGDNDNLFIKDTRAPTDDDAQSVHTVSSKLTNLSLRVRKRAVSGTAATSSSKRVVSQK